MGLLSEARKELKAGNVATENRSEVFHYKCEFCGKGIESKFHAMVVCSCKHKMKEVG